jgi:SNF2 family DNA or RNA helicase
LPRYKFSWTNLPPELLKELARDLGLDSPAPADALRATYGPTPEQSFVRDAWGTLREHWLAKEPNALAAVVNELWQAGQANGYLRPADSSEQLDWLGRRNNTTRLRVVVLTQLVAAGERPDTARSPTTATQPGASTSTLSVQIFKVEGFQVLIIEDRARQAPSAPLEAYPFERAASGHWNVARWRQDRFWAHYPDLDVQVLNASGRPVDGRSLLSTVRATHDQEELVLWPNGSPENTTLTAYLGPGRAHSLVFHTDPATGSEPDASVPTLSPPPKPASLNSSATKGTMTFIPPAPSPGQLVHIRQRRYLVEETTPPPGPGDATLVRLACVDDDAQGQPLQVLWECEVDPEILEVEAWGDLAAKGFDDPKRFAAYVHALRWNAVTAADPRLFQSPFRAGIRLDAYQLEPLRKALLLPRVNIFIADDVGLGKTIEAGLIARELLLRRKVREIVIATPPSMLLQWREEMESRFGLTFEILDRDYIARVRRERGYGVNPWTTHPRLLVSQRLLIDEDYASGLRDHLGDLRPGTLLILDEAHHAAPASGVRYAIDSKTTRAVRDLAHRFEHRLFLSATPHNGHSNSFSALLELLDPQRFCRGVPVAPKLRDEVLVRRLKEDIREIAGGFPRRTPVQEDIGGLPDHAPELRLSKLLDEYRQLREERLSHEPKRAQAASGLLICGLQQRLLSSIEAFARTLRVHRRTVARQWDVSRSEEAPTVSTARLDLLAGSVSNDDDRADEPEDVLAQEEDDQIAEASSASAGRLTTDRSAELFDQEQRLLDQMGEIADAARGRPDAKVRTLVDWIREHMLDGTTWRPLRVLIFTEYDDTKRYLREQLLSALAHTEGLDRRIAVFHGPTPLEEREEIKRAFNAPPETNPVRILIATDAAREGLNFQAHCWHLFHFDVPWNPSRMEQRNGRIDRKLQPQPEVFCHYFVYLQRPEDRVLQVLVRKTETIRKELGSLAQVVEARLTEMLKGGIRHADIDALSRQVEAAEIDPVAKATVDDELEAARQRQNDLRQQIDGLRNRLEASRSWISLDDEHFREALGSALGLIGAEGLRPLPAEDGGPARFAFPVLDERADPTWTETMDSLRALRPRGEPVWQWRRGSPIRPVVFEDPGVVSDDVVQLHLEHRVVRRLLGRFTAQGFVHYDLSRACLAQTMDSVPRIVLLGRLCLYGTRGVRLHEELVPVSARWTDPEDRKGGLTPYRRTAERDTLRLLEDAFLHRGQISEAVTKRLLASAGRDVHELLPFLEERGAEVAADARQQLAARAEAEGKAMYDILVSQRDRVSKTEERSRQLRFNLDEEARQLEANRRHWERRLGQIGREIDEEPERVRRAYDVTAERLEPIGLAYLWPVTG